MRNSPRTLRPTRIGFLVRPTDYPSIRRIFQICSCLWGGVYNPLIPVCDSVPEQWKSPPFRNPTGLELARGYIDFFQPDVFVEAEPGLATKAQIEKIELDIREPRVVSLDSFAQAGSRQIELAFGLNIFDLYQQLYDREFKFIARHDQRVALFDRGSPADSFVDAAFGQLPESGPLAPLAQAYIDAFNPIRLPFNSENWIRMVRERFRTPLFFTRHNIERDHRGHSETILFIVDPDSSLDQFDLWDLRLFTPNVLPVPIDSIKEMSGFLREFITSNHRPLSGNPNGVMIHTTVQFGRSISEERAKAVATELFSDLPVGSWSPKLSYPRIWMVDRVEDHVERPRPSRFYAKESDIGLSFSQSEATSSVRFRSLSPEFAAQYASGAARWVNVIRFRSYGDQDNAALVLPSNYTKLRYSRLRASRGVLVSREGLILLEHFKDHSELLTLETGTQAIIAWLGHHGFEATPSPAGQVANQILRSVGGLIRSQILVHRPTLELLDDMAKSVRRYRDGKTEEFPDRATPVQSWRSLIERRKREQQFPFVHLDDFIKAGILKLGISIQCPNCTNHNWYGLSDMNDSLTCQRCLQAFPFPQGSLDFQYTPWHYRVIGPFTVPNFAGGAYATILALRVFSSTLGHDPQLTYSTNLNLVAKDSRGEIDFAFWYVRDSFFENDEEPLLAFGEAKSFAAESFKLEDVQRMERIAQVFPGAFMVFATMKESLSPDEKSLLSDFARWGRTNLENGLQRAPVVVLTSTEMFCHWHLSDTWKNAGSKYASFSAPYISLDNLWTLAEATQQIYLDLPSRYSQVLQS
jgi:hypothetical protein